MYRPRPLPGDEGLDGIVNPSPNKLNEQDAFLYCFNWST